MWKNFYLSGESNAQFLSVMLERRENSEYIAEKYVVGDAAIGVPLEGVDITPGNKLVLTLVKVRAVPRTLNEAVSDTYLAVRRFGKESMKALVEMAQEKLEAGEQLPFTLQNLSQLAKELDLSVSVPVYS